MGRRFLGLIALAGLGFVLAAGTVSAWYDDITYPPGRYGPDKPLAAVLQDSMVVLDANQHIPNARLEIEKRTYELRLYTGSRLIKTYRIQLGENPRGTKTRRYDSRTPDGVYKICAHNRGSKYYLSLQLNYPNEADIDRALEQKRISGGQAEALRADLASGNCPCGRTKLGGDIFIHGQLPRLTRQLLHQKRVHTTRTDLLPGDLDPSRLKDFYNWTQGCVGMTNPDIRELYKVLPDGTPVEIRE